MMNTKRVIHVCVIAALALMGASATAGQPSSQGGGASSRQGAKPAQVQCAAATPTNERGNSRLMSGGYGNKIQALPEYVRGLLRDASKADLNGAIDPCRLVDNDPDDGAPINDGVDVHELLEKIDDWTSMNHRSLDESEHGLDWRDQQVRFEFEGSDHRLHAYLGYSRIDGDRFMLRLQQWKPLVWNSGATTHGGLSPVRDAAARSDPQSLINNSTQPVPEPSTWAMWLGGLALVGMALRRGAS